MLIRLSGLKIFFMVDYTVFEDVDTLWQGWQSLTDDEVEAIVYVLQQATE